MLISIKLYKINHTVNVNSQSMKLESQTAKNQTSGSGDTNTQYIFNGFNNATNQQITLTYSNNGTNPVIISGVVNNSSI